ncbi:MAG TPA: hypothetical protein VGJ29_11455 [Vicinamibacterales bacterium]|jgi:hypothetical protein
MSGLARARTQWLVVVVFAIGMAWAEAATVYYLRLMVDRIDPYQPSPLPMTGNLGGVELVREAATLVMLLMVGMVAGRTKTTRFGYAAIAFGVWDISYYVFLRVICGWPKSLFDWDVLFLLPLPWWGPVLAPICVALLMILWGTMVIQRQVRSRARSFASTLSWRLNWLGAALALYVFMADSLHIVHKGIDATRTVLPTTFNWPVFVVALILMAAPVANAFGGRVLEARIDHQRNDRGAGPKPLCRLDRSDDVRTSTTMFLTVGLCCFNRVATPRDDAAAPTACTNALTRPFVCVQISSPSE